MSRHMTPDFKNSPYWWEAAPPVPMSSGELDPSYDVVVVGSGITAVSAALPLLRSGRSVAIIDKDDPGAGASRRSAGFIGRVLKKSFSEIAAAKNKDAARKTYAELHSAYAAIFRFVEEEGINCFAQRNGRFIGATSPAHFAALQADLSSMRAEMGFEFEMIPRERQSTELGTSAYFGGALIPDSGSLHPGLYHKGILDRVVAAGGSVFGRTEVTSIEDRGAGFDVVTTAGVTRSTHVVVATNGYTTRHLGWYRRRLVPFTAYMGATEELPHEVLKKAIPHGRTVIDSNTNIDFFRIAPDSRRIVFGGATASGMTDTLEISLRMKSILDRVFPDLADFRLSHAWSGNCAGTFDMIPHVGSRGNLHHAMGYNFAGITMGTQFGRMIAKRILGQPVEASVFGGERFPTLPFYTGEPWFLGLVMRYFDWKDRRFARTDAVRNPFC